MIDTMINTKRMTGKDSFLLTINGIDREYPIQELPEAFVQWNLGQRITMLKHMLSTIGTHQPHGKGGGGFGSHLPVYITNNPDDELFSVNAANKGTGFVAKEEYLDYYLELFANVAEKTQTAPDAPEEEMTQAIKKRISTILDFYEDTSKIDLRCLAGLEIWPGTTSTNFARDPRVSLHFLGMPTSKEDIKYNQWQVNCIWERIEENDKRFQFGVGLRSLTLGHVGKSFVPGHIPVEQTPIKGKHPFGWNLWVIQTRDKGIQPLHS